jgi:pSer/pThr/pTyr-binding forkhead associated (FHA) protein
VSELTLMLIRFAYLAILWIFVLSAISVVRSDMFGARVDSTPRADRKAEKQARRQARSRGQTSGQSRGQTKSQGRGGKPAKRPRSAPTHVAVVEGANAGQTVPLDEAPILIGRGTDAAIRLDDDYVSTRHARIASSGDQWFVEDLGSTNGTYIGTHRLTQPTTIALGSIIRIGKTTLELRK